MNVVSLDIELTQSCNLKCPYCYIGQGLCQSAGTISHETLEDCLDLIAMWGHPRPTPKQKATEVTFYGGEPLLAFGQLPTSSRRRTLGDTGSASPPSATGRSTSLRS